MSYVRLPEGELDQGDLIRKITVVRKAPLHLEDSTEVLVSNICVLSHGCDIDKARFDTVLIARVIRLSALSDGGMAGNIRRNRVYEAFYLPAYDLMPEEAYIDWRTVQAVDKQALINARQSDRFIASLDAEMLAAASDGFWRSFFRLPPR